MPLRRAAVVVIAALAVVVPDLASAQLEPPRGGRSSGALFNGLNNATTRPLPQLPSAGPATPDKTWVPDRYVQSPVNGRIFVPGHWERRLSDHQVFTPPLVGRTPDDGTITFPAGTRPPVDERQAP